MNNAFSSVNPCIWNLYENEQLQKATKRYFKMPVDFLSFSGVHHIDIKVEGTGFMSDIIRLFLLGFNQEHSIDQVSTNFGNQESLCLLFTVLEMM